MGASLVFFADFFGGDRCALLGFSQIFADCADLFRGAALVFLDRVLRSFLYSVREVILIEYRHTFERDTSNHMKINILIKSVNRLDF
ncbi:hypothetical protein DIT68_12030 [Brumimicrobium oceani]|uniref:Uncharacterized protein n=1 Tax=Brumimicrobium oceani TaxID=2100725 RepID=A0A2U2XAP5_9FLAO|nr:hypothetical protein DIT68_12030 [Brumimicrobium oceani]